MVHVVDLSQTTCLPVDILEAILVKSVVAFYVNLKVEEAEPERIASQTTMSVCWTWWTVLTNRKWNKQQLQHTCRGKLI